MDVTLAKNNCKEATNYTSQSLIPSGKHYYFGGHFNPLDDADEEDYSSIITDPLHDYSKAIRLGIHPLIKGKRREAISYNYPPSGSLRDVEIILYKQPTISELENRIKDSEYMLSLKEGWDGEHAETIKLETWKSSTDFLKIYYNFIEEKYKKTILLPEINPGRDGSIDLEWQTPSARLLINFNYNNLAKAAYYGDRYNDLDSIKGFIDLTGGVKDYLATWMKDYI